MAGKEIMTSKQRLLTILSHQLPDRMPIDFGGFHAGIHIKVYTELIDFLGIKDDPRILDPIQQLAETCEELLQRFHADIRYIFPSEFLKYNGQGGFEDEFGATWAIQDEKHHYMGISKHPLEDAAAADIENYPFANGGEKNRFTGIREKAVEISNNGFYALSTDIGGSIFETCCNLRGVQKWFIDTIENPSFCEALMDKILQYWFDYYTEFLSEIGDIVDIVIIGDDLAGQNGPLFSLDFYRNFLKPRHRKLINHIKSLSPARICYHTCGSCFDFIGELIDIGVDVLNPVQTGLKNMEPQKIKGTFGKQISLWGGALEARQSLAFSTPEQISEYVRRNLEIFKPAAGYIFSSTHNIQFDVPSENIVALFDAAYEFGFY